MQCKYAIVGGGVAGLAMGIGLSSLGEDFLLFERATALKGVGAGFGLAANAMQAFEYLGLREEVEKIGFYTETYSILDEKGRTLVAPDANSLSKQYHQKNFTVHRADLHLYLLSQLKSDRLVLGKKLLTLNQHEDHVELQFDDGTCCRCQYLIAADGVKSLIRQQLFPRASPRYAGYTCWRATISNTIGLSSGSETWGVNGRFGMTPLTNNRIYWYACINAAANSQTYRDFTARDLARHFSAYHDPIPAILHHTKDEDLLWNDIVDIRPLPRLMERNIVLIGDAGHATTPNLGQGACQALEDVVVLLDEIQNADNVKDAFSGFEKRRLGRTKYIIDTSRRIGEVAQWSNPLMVAMRNTLLRVMPEKWSQASIDTLINTDFMTLKT